MNANDLTIKQERWLNTYLETGNATEAARQAGYKGNDDTLRNVGTQNLSKLYIRERIQERIAEAGVESREVIGTLAAQMRADITDAFDDCNSPFLKRLREKRLGHLVKAVTIKRQVEGVGEDAHEIEVTRLEFHSSQAAAMQLSKILGMEKAPLQDGDRLEVAITTTMANLNVDREAAIAWLAADPKTSEIVRNVSAS